jgi:hypothetical protein
VFLSILPSSTSTFLSSHPKITMFPSFVPIRFPSFF